MESHNKKGERREKRETEREMLRWPNEKGERGSLLLATVPNLKIFADKVRPRVKLILAQFEFQLSTNSKNNFKFVLIPL